MGWIVQTPVPDVVVLDEALLELARFPLPSPWRASHWATPDLRFVAVSERDGVLLLDRRGKIVWRAPHHAWGGSDSESGSCWVSPDGKQIWATAPTPDGPDQWLVLDTSNGRLLAAAPLRCMAAGSHAIPHPDGRHVGLSVGEGQDGSETYWGHWDDERPRVVRLDDRNRVLADVRPSGGQYLTTPHSAADDSIVVHAFPGGDVVARLAADAVLAESDWFDYGAGYVNERVILVESVEGNAHLLLDADTLTPLGRVEYPPGPAQRGIAPTGQGTWMTHDDLGRHELWRLADG